MRKLLIGILFVISMTLIGCQSTMVTPDAASDEIQTNYSCILFKCGDVVKLCENAEAASKWWGAYAETESVKEKLSELHNGEFARAVVDIHMYIDAFSNEYDIYIMDVRSMQTISLEEVKQALGSAFRRYAPTDTTLGRKVMYYDNFVISDDWLDKRDMPNQIMKYYLYKDTEFEGCYDTLEELNRVLKGEKEGTIL